MDNVREGSQGVRPWAGSPGQPATGKERRWRRISREMLLGLEGTRLQNVISAPHFMASVRPPVKCRCVSLESL